MTAVLALFSTCPLPACLDMDQRMMLLQFIGG
jgi:hypothetical protein